MNPHGRMAITIVEAKWTNELGLRIALRREALGMTQEKLARLTGIAARSIGNYESGRRDPTSHRLFVIARALNCSMDFFYEPIEETDAFLVSED